MSKPAKSPDESRPEAKPELRPRLGRGLAALIGDTGAEPDTIVRSRAQRRVPIEFLRANPRNPRTHFAEADLADLADSIRERGIIQPILVRTVAGVADAYEIVAGERRWRAAQRAELHDVPVVLIEADDRQALEIAIIENVQRADLNILEEAAGYARLLEEFGYSQGDLGRVIGKSRPHVNNSLRLLKLPDEVRAYVLSGEISAGHARALLNAVDPVSIAEKIVERGLSVRAVEELIKREQASFKTMEELEAAALKRGGGKDADTKALEHRIGAKIGLWVDIKHKGDGGEVRLKYESLEQLDHLVSLLGA